MKLDRKLLSAALSLAMVSATVAPVSALDLQAQLGEAKYNRVDVNNYSKEINFSNGSVLVTQETADGTVQYGLTNAAGEMVYPFQNNYLEYMADGLYMVTTPDGLCGVMDSAGNMRIALADQYISYSNGLIYTSSGTFNTDLTPYDPEEEYEMVIAAGYFSWHTADGAGLKDPAGNVVFAPGEYEYINVLGSGQDLAFMAGTLDGQSILMDLNKQVLIPAGTYTNISGEFSGDSIHAVSVYNGESRALLDLKGRMVVPAGCFDSYCGINSQGYAVVSNGDSKDVYAGGTLVNSLSGYDYVRAEYGMENLIFSTNGENWGVMKTDGTVLIPEQYSNISVMKNGDLYCSTRIPDTWNHTYSLINGTDCTPILEGVSYVQEIEPGFYEVRQNEVYGIYSSAARSYTVQPQYTSMETVNPNFIVVSTDSQHMIINKNGELLTPASTERIALYDDGIDGNGYSVYYSLMDHEYALDCGETTGDTVLPFRVNTGSGYQTVYIDYVTGAQMGILNGVVASKPSANGSFAYYAGNDMYGIGQMTNYVAPGPFADVAGNVYYTEPVTWAVDKGITNGVGNNNFDPEGTCTQGHIITFLWRAYGSPVTEGTSNYPDVNPGDWYYDAVLWAQSKGIIDQSFSPVADCTRATAVTYMYRAAGMPAVTVSGAFTDVSDADAPAVEWALSQGITNGTGNNTFTPANTCTRAQIVTFLWRAMGK